MHINKIAAAIKWSLTRVFRVFGLKLCKEKTIIDMRGIDISPLAYNYFRQPLLLDFDISDGRMSVFSLCESNNPFIKSLIRYAKTNDTNDFSLSLNRYYDSFKPKNIYELYGLDCSKDSKYIDYEPWKIPMPWENISIKEKTQLMRSTIDIENRRHADDISIGFGFPWYGPVKKEKLDIEAKRYIPVYRSIKQNGYKRNNKDYGDISVFILVNNEGEVRWWCIGGVHRLVCLVALGWKKIPARISGIIYRREVKAWPNVYNGTFSENIALGIFDSIFSPKNTSI